MHSKIDPPQSVVVFRALQLGDMLAHPLGLSLGARFQMAVDHGDDQGLGHDKGSAGSHHNRQSERIHHHVGKTVASVRNKTNRGHAGEMHADGDGHAVGEIEAEVRRMRLKERNKRKRIRKGGMK